MNILVTGGLGSIGHILCKRLLAEGHGVIIVDDCSVGRKEFLEKLPSAKFYECSVANFGALEKAFLENRIDGVVHLAAKHHIPYCKEHPKETTEINVGGTLNALLLMRRYKVPHIVFASTSSVYKPETRAYTEDDVIGPVNLYGASKLLCEEAVRWYGQELGFTYTILRFFNVYGTDDLVPHVIPEIVEQARKSDVIRVGNLDSKRDFIRVEDIVEAILLSLTKKEAENNVYNLGAGRALSIREVVEAIREASGKDLKIEVVESKKRPVDPPVLLADNSKIKKELGWEPRKEFDLKEVYEKTKFWPVYEV
ncbi:MAG: GDP-mannose 4,6-dehydratase [Nanoarchaeota archaeon]|nr:GDP-mannose 4,6-dehydratase [Nanoarchaeota archaeon]